MRKPCLHSTGTYIYGINEEGTVTGNYLDTAGDAQGFLARLGGAIVTFDVPGTAGYSINDEGTVTGIYSIGYVNHGFLWTE